MGQLSFSDHFDSQLPRSVRQPLIEDEFMNFVWNFRRRMFRLETRDSYSMPEEDQMFARFLSGAPAPEPSALPGGEWFTEVKNAVKQGKELLRVHIVPDVITPYLRYEIEWGYELQNEPSGERVLILPRSTAQGILKSFREDFFLLDDQRLLVVNYDSNNRYVNCEIEQNEDLILAMVRLANQSVQEALSLQDFKRLLRHADTFIKT